MCSIKGLVASGIMAAAACDVCGAEFGGMSHHGRKTHAGLCRGKAQRQAEHAVCLSSDSDLGGDDGIDMPGLPDAGLPDAAPDAPAAPNPPVRPLPPLRLGPDAPMDAAPFAPFLSQSDCDLATLYVSKFGLSVGTLDSILEIAARGETISRTTGDLMRTVDGLPGMAYASAEFTIPGFPDGLYRLFFRKVTEAAAHLLLQHGKDLIRPILIPEDILFNIEEMWQARRYQALLRDFTRVSQPMDILLPLIFFSGACVAARVRVGIADVALCVLLTVSVLYVARVALSCAIYACCVECTCDLRLLCVIYACCV